MTKHVVLPESEAAVQCERLSVIGAHRDCQSVDTGVPYDRCKYLHNGGADATSTVLIAHEHRTDDAPIVSDGDATSTADAVFRCSRRSSDKIPPLS